MAEEYSAWKGTISTFCDNLNTLKYFIESSRTKLLPANCLDGWIFHPINRMGAGATGVSTMNQNPQNPQNPGQGGQHQQGGGQQKPGQQQGGGEKPGQQTQNPGHPGRGGQHDDKR